MKLFVLLVFFFGVKADEISQMGLAISCNRSDMTTHKIGTIEENNKPNSNQKGLEFARNYATGLRDNEEDVTNEDNFHYICPLNNYECIRDIFANNSDCETVSGPVPDPLFLTQNTLFFSSVNVTATYENVNVEGLSNAAVHSFYLNKRTNNLVFAIYIPFLTLKTPKFYFTYRRPGKESIVKSDCIMVTYRELILTAIIPMKPKLCLDLAEIHAYIGDSTNELFVGPGAYNSTNAYVKEAYSRIIETLPVVKREAFLFQSQLFMSIFIQSFICDFKLKIFSV